MKYTAHYCSDYPEEAAQEIEWLQKELSVSVNSVELERTQKAIVGAIEALNANNPERAGRILRRCFWGTDKPQNASEQADREYFDANPE